MAKAKKTETAPPQAPASAQEQPIATQQPSVMGGGFISKPVLVLGLLVGLLSLAVDYLPAKITPLEFTYEYVPRTVEQQELYSNGVGRVPNSAVFGSLERLLEGEALAPEDLVVSPDGTKAFAGLRDGRIVYFANDKNGELKMHDFGRTGNYRETCGEPSSEVFCGRPMGLAFVDGPSYDRYVLRIEDPTFFKESKMLLIVDAYKGLLLMDATGKMTKVFDSVGPRRVRFLNSLAVAKDGSVYVTESSRRFHHNDVGLDILERQPTGRLLHFNPVTTRVTVLANDLAFPNGLALVDDEESLLIAMSFQNKIIKYKVKTKTIVDYAYVPGMPDNLSIEKTADGKSTALFVGLTSIQQFWYPYVVGQPKVRKLLSLVLSSSQNYKLCSQRSAFARLELTTGEITHVYQDTDGSARFLSSVRAFGGHYYLLSGSRDNLVRIPKSAFT